MEELKSILQEEVVEVFKNREKYKTYGIEPPNGILFCGPPQSGKAFIAEKLAEEIGFNFMKVGPLDIGSKYVHNQTKKIKQFFDSAKENSPTILFFDKIDNIIGYHYNLGVNEWLGQFYNCIEQEVFVIGSTNELSSIDPAMLKSGRLEKHYYVVKQN